MGKKKRVGFFLVKLSWWY